MAAEPEPFPPLLLSSSPTLNNPVNHDFESTAASAKKTSGMPVMLIVICAVALAFIGLATIRGVTFQPKRPPDFYFYKQLICLGLACVAALGTAFLPLEKLRRHAWIFAGVAAFLLAITLIPRVGWSINGARRWLFIGNIGIQPSMIGKLALVFFLAHYLAPGQNRAASGSFIRGFGIPFGITALFAVLVAMEPDLGTALFIFTAGMFLLFLGGARPRYLVPAILAAVAWLAGIIALSPNRLARLAAFLDVEGNKHGLTYQLDQSLNAFALGGWTGAGPDAGAAIQIPDAQTDFMLAVIGQRFGLLAVFAVVALFIVILVCGCLHLRRAPNMFQRLLVAGALLLLVLQAALHIGIVTGLLPTAGVPLPFISVGLSNLLLMGVIVGIFINTQRAWERLARDNERKSLGEAEPKESAKAA